MKRRKPGGSSDSRRPYGLEGTSRTGLRLEQPGDEASEEAPTLSWRDDGYRGVFALQGKKDWIGWFAKFGVSDGGTASQMLFILGIIDIALAILVLVKPIRAALLWMTFWGFWTALLRPIVGMPVWDFVERWANWGAPLALLLLIGWPKSWKEWVK